MKQQKNNTMIKPEIDLELSIKALTAYHVEQSVINNMRNLKDVGVTSKKICPHCHRKFSTTEVKSGIFCCFACEYGY